jgi:hypothetical protein
MIALWVIFVFFLMVFPCFPKEKIHKIDWRICRKAIKAALSAVRGNKAGG